MVGFYTKEEASNLLGVTTRQITNYLTNGKLRKVYHNKRVWIPHEDVHLVYENAKKGLVPHREEFSAMEKRIKQLEETVEVLKLGIGFGASKPPKSESDLLLLHSEVLQDLSSPGWEVNRISEIADIFVSLQEDDLQNLCRIKGEVAWAPLFDLSDRMINFVEVHESYPECGLGTLRARLIKAKDRLLGLILVASKIDTSLPRKEAVRLRESLDIIPNQIDTFVARYIERRSA
tara:strand:+ start:1043 stop:1741 length:699 start_codon:yes stop_codon:yes gene_type:complete